MSVINKLLTNYPEESIYNFDEDDIRGLIFNHFETEKDAFIFMMKLRNLSFNEKYNKVSKKTDNPIVNYLLENGHFKTPSSP